MAYTVNNPSVRRAITAQADLWEGSNLITTFTKDGAIKTIDIQRVGAENKFFGFGITQRLNIHLVDAKREININTTHRLKISLNGKEYPYFFVTEVNRDENTNELSVTAYDAIYMAANYSATGLELGNDYTLVDYINAAQKFLNDYGYYVGSTEILFPQQFNLSYQGGANFDGTETLRDALTAVAEVTGSIYYLKMDNGAQRLVFAQLVKDVANAIHICKDEYFTLSARTNKRLVTIQSTTELEDNIYASTGLSGTTQIIRTNPFLDLHEDRPFIVQGLIDTLGNLTIAQLDCDWRGDTSIMDFYNPITITTKDDDVITTYLFDDTIIYDGGLKEKITWHYENVTEIESLSNNSASLGEALKETFAKVDKVNQQIDLVASKTEANEKALAALQLTTGNINVSVQEVQKYAEEGFGAVSEEITTLSKKVEASMTADEVQIMITKEHSQGTNRVVTDTGFTFDSDGLTIEKSGSEMKTLITEDGMRVYRDDMEVLIANNEGVQAANLHANTYLIIGETSRFEDYEKEGELRTGCFWIGGVSYYGE